MNAGVLAAQRVAGSRVSELKASMAGFILAVMKSEREARERIVGEHIEAEQRGEWDRALSTFHRPRYEVTATGEVHDGPEGVRLFYSESARAFPDLSFETRGIHHADSTVVHEVIFRATHLGTWRGLPATRKPVEYSMLNLFLFEEDRLICERMYFDLLTPLRQLGIARDPTSRLGRLSIAWNHPLTLGRALLGSVLRQISEPRVLGSG